LTLLSDRTGLVGFNQYLLRIWLTNAQLWKLSPTSHNAVGVSGSSVKGDSRKNIPSNIQATVARVYLEMNQVLNQNVCISLPASRTNVVRYKIDVKNKFKS
jgi:hypothetical protein